MAKVIKTITLFPLFVIVAFVVCSVIIIGANADKTKHPEAAAIRSRYQGGLCEGTEIYFSPPRGTLLILCGLPESNMTGGLIYRISENFGHNLLGPEDSYEVTIYAAKRAYWDNVIVRDEYYPIAMYPDIERKINEWFTK